MVTGRLDRVATSGIRFLSRVAAAAYSTGPARREATGERTRGAASGGQEAAVAGRFAGAAGWENADRILAVLGVGCALIGALTEARRAGQSSMASVRVRRTRMRKDPPRRRAEVGRRSGGG